MNNLKCTLQRLLKLHGDLSISELARVTKIPQPTLHHMIEGKTKKPRQEALNTLAQYFSISIPELMGSKPFSLAIPDSIKESLQISTVPLIDWNAAKDWHHESNNIIKFDEIILKRNINKKAFALQLQTSSMEPLFQEKSILIFDPEKSYQDRDFVLVYFKNNDHLMFNRIFIDGKNKYIKLEKNNGDADLIKLNSPDDYIIATLIEVRMQF